MMSTAFTGLNGQAMAERGAASELADTVGRLHRTLRRRVHDRLPGPALPQSQVEVLRLLDQQPGLRAGDVADRLGLAPNTASTVIQQLVQLGYVARAVDTQDRRSARLTVTESARRRMDRWHDLRGAVLAQALESLAASERDSLLAALPALARLAESVEELAP
jgi:DNA-binding MarR family transcriptional regulator